MLYIWYPLSLRQVEEGPKMAQSRHGIQIPSKVMTCKGGCLLIWMASKHLPYVDHYAVAGHRILDRLVPFKLLELAGDQPSVGREFDLDEYLNALSPHAAARFLY